MIDFFIIAIDFGTTHSGYAISLTAREEIDPCIKFWGEEVGLETPKTPTCILFDEHEEFISFGDEAKASYILKKSEGARNMLFFDCSKMSLYGTKLNRDLKIKAANGKSMKALKVFAEALRFLKDDALQTIDRHTEGRKFLASDFTWVLTVPDIWDPSAKQFMREAATQAGIVTDLNQNGLVLALHSEAALSCCLTLPVDGFITRGLDKMDESPGTRYAVVAVEDENIDINVHEVLEGGGLKELHRASYNDLGGQSVDRKFKEFMREIFSNGVWDEYENNYPSEVQRMLYEFSMFKKVDEDIDITCPLNLVLKRQDIEEYFKRVQGASWDDGSIRISKEKLRSFFAQSLLGITHNLREINKYFNIGCILLVGSYADSEILRRHITEEFIDDCKVLCPFRPQEAILNGAAMLGVNPSIKLPKSAFTYGIGVSDRFDELKHREDRKFTNKEGEWTGGIFIKLVEVDEEVSWNKTIEFIFYPIEADQTIMNVYFYRTKNKNPNYVTEEGVEEICCLFLNSPKTEGGRSREVKMTIRFGCMEIKTTVRDLISESKSSTKFDFVWK